jgi:ubiquinone/menaquinone biosynthesis C-methylase UbiE
VSRYRDQDGLLGQMHRDVMVRTIDLALSLGSPQRVLDVGCGAGLLRELGKRLPEARELTGIDAAAMIEAARLPFDDFGFDLVISATSFDRWADQGAGLAECHRVLAPGGRLVLTDLFSLALLPTLIGARRDRARTPLRATRLLAAAGFRSVVWHRLYAEIWLSGIFKAVTASAPLSPLASGRL